MIRDRLKGLARRVRERGRGEGVGTGFGPAQDRAFAQAHDNAEGSFQVFSAAMVSSWEVLLTDLGRGLAGRLPEEERGRLVERVSDALVPTQTPIQGVGRKFSHALKTGVKEALQQERLDAAVGPLCGVLGKLPEEVATGWAKTSEYLAPLFEVLEDPEVGPAFAAGGPALAGLLGAAARTFEADMAALPEQRELEPALIAAVDRWRDAAVRAVETEVYARRELLVQAARALPKAP